MDNSALPGTIAKGDTGPAGAAGATGAGYGGTSTTSLAIGTGSKAFTTQAGLAYVVGSRVRAASAANTANYMEGVVSAYSGTTLTVNVDAIGGSGTLADWNLSIAGQPGAAGAGGTFVGARVYNSTSTSVPHTTQTTLNFDTESYDTDAFHDPAVNPSRLTVPTGQGGKYLIVARVAWAASAAGFRQLLIYRNGTGLIAGTQVHAASVNGFYQESVDVYELAAGDYIQVKIQQDSGGSLNSDPVGAFGPMLSLTKL